MSDFRQLSDRVWASPQITAADVEAARAKGVTAIVNNRPDGEVEGQPTGGSIRAAAEAAGLAYHAIPISHSGFSRPQIDAMASLLEMNEGRVLAYCRSGTRSTFLWALARASAGEDPARLADAAAHAGYDVAPVRPAMDMLAAPDRA